jgi:predicted deacylase
VTVRTRPAASDDRDLDTVRRGGEHAPSDSGEWSRAGRHAGVDADAAALAWDARRSRVPPVGLRPDHVAALQRLAGNGAVAGLLSPATRLVQRDLDTFIKSTAAGKAASGPIGTTSGKRPITAHFFPGASKERALVIGGVHGSELSGIAVAEELIRRLSLPTARKPFFSVIVVPSLFPDNVAARRAFEAKVTGKLSPADYAKEAAKAGDPGRVTPGQEDPNRQMPAPGTDFDPTNPKDAAGRVIEAENQALLALIQRFQPVRIASLHAIKNVNRAGVFSDPHPDATGADPALAARTDLLALTMARRVKELGGRVGGNKVGTKGETSLYPGQNPKLSKEQIERENKKGTTLGQWGPPRGISVLTIEMPEQYDTSSPVTDANRAKEIDSHAQALEEIFLGPTPEAMVEALIEGMKAVAGAVGAVGGAVGGALGAAAGGLLGGGGGGGDGGP